MIGFLYGVPLKQKIKQRSLDEWIVIE